MNISKKRLFVDKKGYLEMLKNQIILQLQQLTNLNDVSGVHKSVFLDFISQNFVLSQNLSKLSSSKISLQKRTNLDFFIYFFELSCY